MHALFAADTASHLLVPLALSTVQAGFPSPADSYIEGTLDLNTFLIKHPAATFFVRVQGDSMTGAGIHSGDLLVVDRAVEARDGSIVIASCDGDLTVKRLRKQGATITLCPENPDYSPVSLPAEGSLVIWGVATSVIHPL